MLIANQELQKRIAGAYSIKEGTRIGKKFTVGQQISHNGSTRVYSCKNNNDVQIKVETSLRPPRSFFNEVKVQSKVASEGYAVNILFYTVGYFPSNEDGDKLFYVMVIEKMSYSLEDVQEWYPFLGQDGLQKIALQLMNGL